MMTRAWILLKASLGIGLLILGGMVAAGKLDRERREEAAQDAAFLRDGDATGSVRPRPRSPGGPTQRPSP